jgi:hypothetical protein
MHRRRPWPSRLAIEPGSTDMTLGRRGLRGKGGDFKMRKVLFAAILAASAVLTMAVSVGASPIPPCC